MDEGDFQSQAGAALLAVRRQRAAAADRLVTPWWYHPALGLLVGGVVAAQAAHSALVRALALALFFVGVGVLVRAYRRLTGVWVSGYRRGPAGRVTAALVGAYLACLLAGAVLDYALGYAWGFVAAGAAIAVLTVVLGRRFDVALREELRSGS
jgi:hypothetical protein